MVKYRLQDLHPLQRRFYKAIFSDEKMVLTWPKRAGYATIMLSVYRKKLLDILAKRNESE